MVLGLWHLKVQGKRQFALKTLTNPWAKNVKGKSVSKGGSLIKTPLTSNRNLKELYSQDKGN